MNAMNHSFEAKIVKSSTHQLTIYLAIPVGLVMGYLIINLVNQATGHRLFFGEYLIPALIVFIAGVIGIILVRRLNMGRLVVTRKEDQQLKVEVHFPNQEPVMLTGKWESLAFYTKTYARYGMYYKNLALALFCDDKSFCLLRHQLGGLKPAPDGFKEVNQLLNAGGPEYWCHKTPELFSFFTS